MRLVDARYLGIDLPISDIDVLLCALLNRDKAWLLAHPEDKLSSDQVRTLEHWCARRRAGEPVAYIVCERWFYGRSFLVDNRVLVPRPSTEALVDLALRTLDAPSDVTELVDGEVVVMSRIKRRISVSNVVDLGTGSGCIAIILSLERPYLCLLAADVSREALAVAEANMLRFKVQDRVQICESDGLKSMQTLLEKPFLFVSNPPYIPNNYVLSRDVHAFEPHMALYGGSGHGAQLLMRLAHEAWSHPLCMGIALECRADQVSYVDNVLNLA